MRLKAEQLEQQLRKQLLPVYLVTGDEPLLCQEAMDQLRTACRQAGIDTREVYHGDNSFRRDDFLGSAMSLSLFGDRKLLELRLPGAKASADTAAAVVEYCNNPPDDTVLLISADKLDRPQENTAWFKGVDKVGGIVQIWPLEARNLPAWLEQRARKLGLELNRESLELLAERVEGNLLAAMQELEKLKLAGFSGAVDSVDVEASVADSARYNVYGLIDTLLAGNASDGLRMLHGLRGEGAEAPVVLWALARELRSLHKLAGAADFEQAAREARLRDARKPLLRRALQRLKPMAIMRLLSLAAEADQAIKGLQPECPWQKIERIALHLAGAPMVRL